MSVANLGRTVYFNDIGSLNRRTFSGPIIYTAEDYNYTEKASSVYFIVRVPFSQIIEGEEGYLDKKVYESSLLSSEDGERYQKEQAEIEHLEELISSSTERLGKLRR